MWAGFYEVITKIQFKSNFFLINIRATNKKETVWKWHWISNLKIEVIRLWKGGHSESVCVNTNGEGCWLACAFLLRFTGHVRSYIFSCAENCGCSYFSSIDVNRSVCRRPVGFCLNNCKRLDQKDMDKHINRHVVRYLSDPSKSMWNTQHWYYQKTVKSLDNYYEVFFREANK